MDRLSAVLIYTVFISPVVIVSVRIYIIQNIANTYQLHFTVVLRKGEFGDYLVFKVYFFLMSTNMVSISLLSQVTILERSPE